MTTKPLFTPTAGGTAYDIQPAGVLLLAADTAYGDPSQSTPEGLRKASAFIDAVLCAARAAMHTA